MYRKPFLSLEWYATRCQLDACRGCVYALSHSRSEFPVYGEKRSNGPFGQFLEIRWKSRINKKFSHRFVSFVFFVSS